MSRWLKAILSVSQKMIIIIGGSAIPDFRNKFNKFSQVLCQTYIKINKLSCYDI